MPRGNRRRNQRARDDFSSEEDGVLHIGGVRVRVDGRGNGIADMKRPAQGGQGRRTAPAAPAPASPSASTDGTASSNQKDSDTSSIRDYLENLEAADDQDDAEPGLSDREAVRRRRRKAQQELEMLRRFSGVELGHEGNVEDIGWAGEDGSEEEDASSLSSFSGGKMGSNECDALEQSEARAWDERSTPSTLDHNAVYTAKQMDDLAVEVRFPVSMRTLPPPPPPPPRDQPSSSKKGKRSGAKGKLVPGEKAQLRRQGVEGRRNVRAAGRGFDLGWINQQLRDLVVAGHDMHAFPSLGKQAGKLVQRLAALYGCKSSLQGSKKLRMVVVMTTPHTALPQGEAFLKVGAMLVESNAAWVGAMGGLPAMPDEKGAGSGGRWAGARSGRKGGPGAKPKRDHVWGGRYGGEGGSVAAAAAAGAHPVKRKFSQPVSFVSHGVVDPSEAAVEVVLVQGGGVGGEEDAGPASAPPPYGLLEVFEDRLGSVSDDGEGFDGRPGLGMGAGAVQVGGSFGGSAPAEGLTKLSKSARKQQERSGRPARGESSGGGGAGVAGDFADFERHTTGIGSKLLSKWGFSGAGAGLGAAQNGIAEPVKATQRPKGRGLGA